MDVLKDRAQHDEVINDNGGGIGEFFGKIGRAAINIAGNVLQHAPEIIDAVGQARSGGGSLSAGSIGNVNLTNISPDAFIGDKQRRRQFSTNHTAERVANFQLASSPRGRKAGVESSLLKNAENTALGRAIANNLGLKVAQNNTKTSTVGKNIAFKPQALPGQSSQTKGTGFIREQHNRRRGGRRLSTQANPRPAQQFARTLVANSRVQQLANQQLSPATGKASGVTSIRTQQKQLERQQAAEEAFKKEASTQLVYPISSKLPKSAYPDVTRIVESKLNQLTKEVANIPHGQATDWFKNNFGNGDRWDLQTNHGLPSEIFIHGRSYDQLAIFKGKVVRAGYLSNYAFGYAAAIAGMDWFFSKIIIGQGFSIKEGLLKFPPTFKLDNPDDQRGIDDGWHAGIELMKRKTLKKYGQKHHPTNKNRQQDSQQKAKPFDNRVFQHKDHSKNFLNIKLSKQLRQGNKSLENPVRKNAFYQDGNRTRNAYDEAINGEQLTPKAQEQLLHAQHQATMDAGGTPGQVPPSEPGAVDETHYVVEAAMLAPTAVNLALHSGRFAAKKGAEAIAKYTPVVKTVVRQQLAKRTRYVRFGAKPVNSPKFRKQYDKHAKDFGQVGDINTRNQELHQQAIRDFIEHPHTQKIPGTYWKKTYSGYNYYQSVSKRWVFVTKEGEFHAGWRLSPDQIYRLLTEGYVK